MLELKTCSTFVENYSTPFLVMEMNLLRSQFFLILTSNFSFSKEHAKSLREKISPNKTFNESYYGPMFGQAESHGTAHVSVIGPDGELVSVTRCVEGLHYI